MAFRFILLHGEERQETAWFDEAVQVGPTATAVVAMSHLRAMFPKAAVSIERENRVDAKDAGQMGEDLKALKEK